MALIDGLISYWELGEASGTRNDSHGSNHLTDNNTVASATGKVGDGADFERDNSEFLSRASNASLAVTNIDFSICAWVKPASIENMIILSKDDETNGREYTLDIDSIGPTFRFYIAGGAGFDIVVGDTAPTVGNWFLVVARYSETTGFISIQINNGAIVTSAATSDPPVGTAEFRIGAREYSGFEGFFDGVIDQVGFWKPNYLDEDEVAELYNNGNGLSYADLVGGAAEGFLLVAN